jgi:N-acetylmuramoyl-L-alanine amidase
MQQFTWMRRAVKQWCLLTAIAILAGCAAKPYGESNKLYKQQARQYANLMAQYPLVDSMFGSTQFIGTTNFNLRKPNFVIIHHTAQNSCEQTLKAFTLVKSQVSAHYVICKDGTVHHLLNDYLRAWHAGTSKWGNDADINSSSIGIELDNNGFEVFSAPQMESLLKLLAVLKKAYNIPTANFIGHGDIAPGRKNDPNIYFPWSQMAQNGFGNWYSDTTNVQVPENFNAVQSLRVIGYDVKDSVAAIVAFKRHWVQDTIPFLTAADRKILFRLSTKY